MLRHPSRWPCRELLLARWEQHGVVQYRRQIGVIGQSRESMGQLRFLSHGHAQKNQHKSSKLKDDHDHDHNHLHDHDHKHSLFSPHVHTAEENMGFRASLAGRDAGSKITLLGLYSDVALTLLKAVAGYWLHSASLMADAGHSLTDTTSGLVTLASLKLSQRGSKSSMSETDIRLQRRWPYGLGKVETLGGLAMGVMLMATAGGIGLHSLHILQELLSSHAVLENAHAHGIDTLLGHDTHDHGATAKASLDHRAIYFALLSIAVKEYLYRVTTKVGKKVSSTVLLAYAQHHRLDALLSGVTLVAIAGSYAGLSALDPLGGLIVSIMIGRSGFQITSDAGKELCDVGLSATIIDKARQRILALHIEGVNGIDYISGYRSGQFLMMDVKVVVMGDMPMARWDEVNRRIQDEVRASLAPQQVRQVRVRPTSTGS